MPSVATWSRDGYAPRSFGYIHMNREKRKPPKPLRGSGAEEIRRQSGRRTDRGLVIAQRLGVLGKEARRAAVVSERHDASTRAERGKQ